MTTKQHAYKGSFLNVMKENQTLPNGRTATIEWVEHPGAVVIVPFLRHSTIILLKQYRPAIKKWIYEAPAGTIEYGEHPLRCAHRETQEETGYSAKRFTRLGIIYPVPGYSTEKLTVYKAENLTPVDTRCEDDEIITTKPCTKQQARQLFHTGKIVDAKTICCLAMIGWL